MHCQKRMPKMVLYSLILLFTLSVVMILSYSRSIRYTLLENSGSVLSNLRTESSVSSNGQWMVYLLEHSRISIASLSFPYKIFTLNLPPLHEDAEWSKNEKYDFTWSPDGQALLLWSYKGKYNSQNSYIILEYSKGEWSQSDGIQFSPLQTNDSYEYIWSKDGSKIAFYHSSNDKNGIPFNFVIDVFDRKANFLNQVIYNVPSEELSSYPEGITIKPFWLEGAFILAEYPRVFPAPETRLVVISESNSEFVSPIISIDGSYEVLGSDPSNKFLLLYQNLTPDLKPPFHYVIVNINTKSIVEKKQIISNDFIAYDLKPVGPINNYSLGSKCSYLPLANIGDENGIRKNIYHLIVWDWNRQRFIDYGNIRNLIGWDSIGNGYLVLKSIEGTSFSWFQLFKP